MSDLSCYRGDPDDTKVFEALKNGKISNLVFPTGEIGYGNAKTASWLLSHRMAVQFVGDLLNHPEYTESLKRVIFDDTMISCATGSPHKAETT